MKLREFVSKFVCRNSLIRLWKQNEDGSYEFLYKEDERKHGMVAICMEWQLLDNKVWQSYFNDCEVIGVKDIVVDDFYREAINIVVDVREDKEVVIPEPLHENTSDTQQLKMEISL